MFFNWYLSNEINTLADNSRVEPTILFMEKISFSLILFSGHFYGQSFIKTIRGPFDWSAKIKLRCYSIFRLRNTDIVLELLPCTHKSPL